MRTALTDLLGVPYPIVGFNRSPAVVAEVTKAGGFGVLAASGYSPEELDAQLTWIEKEVEGKPYGVDLLVPEKFTEGDPGNLIASLRAQIPQGHLDFVRDLLALDVKVITDKEDYTTAAQNWLQSVGLA